MSHQMNSWIIKTIKIPQPTVRRRDRHVATYAALPPSLPPSYLRQFVIQTSISSSPSLSLRENRTKKKNRLFVPMACRRRHPISRASTFTENLSSSSSSSNDFNPQISRFSTFKEDSRSRFFRDDASSPPPASPSSSSSSSVAAQAIRAASAYRESDFSSTNGESASVKLNSPNSQRLNRSQQVNSPCPSSCFFLLVT